MAKDKNNGKKKRHAITRTGVWKKKFLESLKAQGVVSQACDAAMVPRSTAYKHLKLDEGFASEWQEALEVATDTLEMEAVRRARDGTLKPVFQGGIEVGQIREYSDTLLIFLLKANREKFRNANNPSLNVDASKTTNYVIMLPEAAPGSYNPFAHIPRELTEGIETSNGNEFDHNGQE